MIAMGKKFSFDDIKVEIIQGKNMSHDEQVKRVEKVNEIFVDIAVKYHVNKMKIERMMQDGKKNY